VGAAGAWAVRSEAAWSSLRRGFGVGLQHPTPVGPVGVEWGRADGRGRLFVSLGYR
jgi:hypothetical protein